MSAFSDNSWLDMSVMCEDMSVLSSNTMILFFLRPKKSFAA